MINNYRLISIAIALGLAFCSVAQDLKFGSNGTFKIAQFTDTHFKWEEPDKSQAALDCIESVLTTEKPDLVIFTGDQVYGTGVMNAMMAQINVVKAHGVPFGIIFGNHDGDYDMTRDEIYDFVQPAKGSVMPKRESEGAYDYAIEIRSSVANRPGFVLYCLDTHSKNSIVKGYDCLLPPQIDWYQAKSDSYIEQYGQRIPALMFIHIPLPEMQNAADEKKLSGNKKEKICCSVLNTGMFMALREKGDVRGVFCGHDHNNDFAAEFLDVLLAYGRYSGGSTVYNSLKNGARIIKLNEMEPNTIETWIRQSDGLVTDRLAYRRSMVVPTHSNAKVQ